MAAPTTNEELRAVLQVRPPEEAVQWINMLIYGEPGAGKTFFGGTAADDPRTSPVLFLDIEGGLATIRDRSDIDVPPPIRSMKSLEDTFNTLYGSIKDGSLYYKTIVIDSLSELADLDMRVIMKQAKDANPDKVDIDVASPREWGKTRNHMRLIIRGFRDLPCNVIFTASLGSTSEEGQPTKFHPGLAGKLKVEASGFMDIVGFHESVVDTVTGEKFRRTQFLGTKKVQAKDRTGRLGDQLQNITVPMIWDLINQEAKEGGDTANES